MSQGWLRLCQRRWVRTDGSAPAAPAQCAVCRCRSTHRTDHGIDLEGTAAGATSGSGWSAGMPQASRSCPCRPPTTHTGLPAEALRRRSPNAVAVFAAHAQASDWLMPKLRPLELSDTALEPRRAHGQRRRGASAQRWRGAHSVAAAGAAGRFCSELTLRSELPPTSKYRLDWS